MSTRLPESVTELSHKLTEFYDKMSSWEHSVVKGSSLSPSQMHTIEVIGHHQNMRMKELAQRLSVTTGTLTVAVDKLEKRGLVMRKPHEEDRRSWLVVLTEKGMEMFSQHHRFHTEFTQEISATLATDEIEQLNALLSRLLQRM